MTKFKMNGTTMKNNNSFKNVYNFFFWNLIKKKYQLEQHGTNFDTFKQWQSHFYGIQLFLREKSFSHCSLGLDLSPGHKQGLVGINTTSTKTCHQVAEKFLTTSKNIGSEPSALFTINSQLLVVTSSSVFLFTINMINGIVLNNEL